MKTLTKEHEKRIHYDNRSHLPGMHAGESDSHIPCRIALVNAQGNIVAVNSDWLLLAKQTGANLNRVGPGANYLEVCRHAKESSVTSRKALAGIEAVLKGKTRFFSMDYEDRAPSGLAYFRMNVTPIVYGKARLLIAHMDITALQTSIEEDVKFLRQFTRRLIHAQEEERQRISREIHDDLGHRIALMSFSIRQMMKQHPKTFASTMADLNKVLDGITDFSAALRNLSHGLYPPPLQYLGIKPALMSLSDEFERTSGIRIDLLVPADAPRLSPEVELCIFRIVQESLQNVARHSGAGSVRIVFDITREEIELTITDAGRGFSPSEVKKKGGLGLLSMEERALSMGGRLTVTSAPGAGTEVHLSVPLDKAYSRLVSDDAVTDGISNQFRNRLEPELPHRR
jgi:signal transduction histidine kinase